MAEIPFRAAGTFAGPSYVEREADRLLLNAIKQNKRYPYIVAPRQSGKSSLLLHAINSLDPVRYRSAFADLSTFNITDYDNFWQSLLDEIATSANLYKTALNTRRPENTFLRWLDEIPERLIVFIDEIDALLGAPFREQFFSKLRSLFNKRAEQPKFDRLLIVLSGVAHPTQLIKDNLRSPFNVGIAIKVDDLTLERAKILVSHLGASGSKIAEGVAESLHSATGGSVYLSQLLLERLWIIGKEHGIILNTDVDAAVDAVVEGSRGEIHFLNIHQLLISNVHLLAAFGELFAGRAIDESRAQDLRLVGISDGIEPFQNPIYLRVFGLDGPLDVVRLIPRSGLKRSSAASIAREQAFHVSSPLELNTLGVHEGNGRWDGMESGSPVISIARLPIPDSRAVGRNDEIAWLDACWAEGANVATIIAFGGVGKSALVWDWLRGMQRDDWRGAERVYGWSFYSQGTTDRRASSDEFISTALRWFGNAEPNMLSPWDKGELLAQLIRKRRTLLVLDGLEPLQWGSGQEEGRIKDPALATLLKELGSQNTGLCVITSRLAVQDLGDFPREKSWRLNLSYLTEEAGVDLLLARGVKGTEQELREAVRDYGGHSLALALLGTYLQERGSGDVSQRHEIGPLVEDERLGEQARRVMVAYERLFGSRSAEVSILRMLGLFDRPADDSEIAVLRAKPVVPGLNDAVVELDRKGWNHAVSTLRRVGLVVHSQGERDMRLDAHPLVREHFGEQVQRELADSWQEGHRRLYEHLKTTAKELPDTIEQMKPLYEAVAHGCKAGKKQEALDSVWWKRIQRENEYFNLRKLGAFSSEIAVLSNFFDPPWEKLAAGLSERDQALVVSVTGFALQALGRLTEADELVRKGLEQFIVWEDWKNAAATASNLSALLHNRGELRAALVQAREGVALANMSGDPLQRVAAMSKRGETLHAMGQWEEAVAQFEEAEHFQKGLAPAYPLLYSIQGFRFCNLLLDQCRYAIVKRRAAKTLKWAKKRGDLLSIALDHLLLGRADLLAAQCGAVSDISEAASHLKQATDGLRRYGDQSRLPFGLLARALLHIHNQAFELARGDLEETITLATRCGFRLHEAEARLGLTRLSLAEGNASAASEHISAARRLIDETGYLSRNRELTDLEARARSMAMSTLKHISPIETVLPVSEPVAPIRPVLTPTTILHPSPTAGTTPGDYRGKVDFAILTTRQEEFQAVLDRFPPFTRARGRRVYSLHRLELSDGSSYLIAVVRCIEQGNTEAIDAARDVLEELEPRWLLTVGIAGGAPSGDFTLGDVVVSSQIVDFSVDAVIKDKPFEYALMGGPVHNDVTKILANLHTSDGEFKKWNSEMSIGMPRPPINIADSEFYGDKAWQSKVKASINRQMSRTKPIVAVGAIGASDRLFNDVSTVFTLLQKAGRQVLAVEMESAGLYRAATGRGVPLLVIRGLSDIVGFKRDSRWTGYACHAAAAFTRAFLRTGPIEPRAAERGAADQPTQVMPWPAKLSGAELQDLVSALFSAFPTRNALAQMVRTRLGKNLDVIAAPGNLRATVFELVSHAEAEGFAHDLFNSAFDAASANPELKALAAKWRV